MIPGVFVEVGMGVLVKVEVGVGVKVAVLVKAVVAVEVAVAVKARVAVAVKLEVGVEVSLAVKTAVAVKVGVYVGMPAVKVGVKVLVTCPRAEEFIPTKSKKKKPAISRLWLDLNIFFGGNRITDGV